MTAEAAGERYYLRAAAAFARGALGPSAPATATPAELVAAALGAGLRLQSFKRSSELPRVRRVLGILRGLSPESLLDVGFGRGAFLWPLLEAFPDLAVTAIDRDQRHVDDARIVARGGLPRLSAHAMDATRLALPDRSVDGVTMLEVLEHLERPGDAAREAVRVAGRFVVASVPSRPDDNPQHLTLFSRESLTALFVEAGAARASVEYVPNHMILLALVGTGLESHGGARRDVGGGQRSRATRGRRPGAC